MSKRIILIVGLLLLLFVGYEAYQILMPSAPNLAEVDNTVKNRSTKNWSKVENTVLTTPGKKAFFGDLHVHTKYSFDAFIGGVSAGPSEAYDFAKGKPIDVIGKQVKIVRPLDFAAITDHSEYLGEMYTVQDSDTEGHYSIAAWVLRSIGTDTVKQRKFFNRMRGASDPNAIRTHPDFFSGFKSTMSAWDEEIAAAEAHYDPGNFTTFAAYEWSLGRKGAHLHRNVIFRDMIIPNYPISAFEEDNEMGLWESLETYRDQGSTVLAIPHNANLSHGMTFPLVQEDGSEIDLQYAQIRSKNEPLVEIHQAKGNSEVHPDLWSNDEYANFEMYEEEDAPNENNFIRHVLKRGLALDSKLGENPYQYGLIGSTDTHNGTPGNTEEEDAYQGNHLFVDTDVTARVGRDWILNEKLKVYEAINPGGLVGIWAEANTRGHLYDAMMNKETFATSGGRIQVRFFAGNGFDVIDKSSYNWESAYEAGVPMGHTYSSKHIESPEFLLWAMKDVEGANLDRIQVVKGWYDEDKLQEKIYDAIVSEQPVKTGDQVVNLSTGAIDPSYGSTSLQGIWTDPDYDPREFAFYYLRVLEVPSPRYTLWDEIRYGVTYPADVPKTIRERAWSSPIWTKRNVDL